MRPIVHSRGDSQKKSGHKRLARPTGLTPLQSDSYVVEKTDYEGGSGANFIVEWSAEGPISKSGIEAAMIGVDPKYQMSLGSQLNTQRQAVGVGTKNLATLRALPALVARKQKLHQISGHAVHALY